jgi:hypothetical protein
VVLAVAATGLLVSATRADTKERAESWAFLLLGVVLIGGGIGVIALGRGTARAARR